MPFKKGHIVEYRHVNCAFLTFRKAKILENIITDISQVDGLNEITDADRSRINELVQSENTLRKPLPKTRINEKISKPTVSSKRRKNALLQSDLPVIPVMFTNADQFTPSKKVELQERIQKEKPLIIAVCEMKPKNKNDYSELDYDISDYKLHPVHLDDDLGRGVAVYTHTSIEKSVAQIEPDLQFEETCLLEVRLRGGDLLLFACFYRSPTTTEASEVNNERLNRLFQCIMNKKYSHICLVGDFNFKKINWDKMTTRHEGSTEAKFLDTVQNCFLHQHMELPTRRRGNDEPSLLDLLFTNEALQISDISHHAPLGKSDHDVVAFKFHCYIDYTKPKGRYVYDKADFEGMKNDLKQTRWKEIFVRSRNTNSIEELWTSLKSKLLDLRAKFVPKVTASAKPKWREKGSVPIDNALQLAIRNKKLHHRHWMKAKSESGANDARHAYRKANNKVKRMMRKAKRNFERSIAQNSKSCPKSFWSYVRSKLRTKAGVAPLLKNVTDKTSVKFTDEEKSNILQDQFSSVFTHEPDGPLPPFEKETQTKASSTSS